MQDSTQNIYSARLMLQLDIRSLEERIKTLYFDNRQYNNLILEMAREYKFLKQKLEQEENKIKSNKTNEDLFKFQQQLQSYDQCLQESFKSQKENSLKQMQTQVAIAEEQSKILEASQLNCQVLVNQLCTNMQFVPEKITLNIFEREKSERLIQSLEDQWKEVFDRSKKLQQKLTDIVNINPNQHNQNFLQCQQILLSNQDLQNFKQEFQDIKNKTQSFKQKIENAQNQDQNNQAILNQVLKLVNYNLQTVEKSITLIEQMIFEQKRAIQKNVELLQKNTDLTCKIKEITYEHLSKIKTLEKKMKVTQEELNKQSIFLQISNSYAQNSINKISQFSLEIHKKFYKKIENNLSDLAISFMNISIRNLLGSFIANKGRVDENLQNKTLAIEEINIYLNSIKEGQNKNIKDFIRNSKRLLPVFEIFLCNSGQDSQSRCFTECFRNSQKAIDQLQNYLESIEQGVQEFTLDHNRLKSFEQQQQG